MFRIREILMGLALGTSLMASAEIQKPCGSRGGDAYPNEGSGICRGNLQLEIPLSTSDFSLIYNSQSKLNLGYGVGWSLNAEAFFEKVSSQTGVLQLGDGTRIDVIFDGAKWRAKFPSLYENTFTERQDGSGVLTELDVDGSYINLRKYGNRYLMASNGSRKGVHQSFTRHNTTFRILSIKNFFGQLNPFSVFSNGFIENVKDFKGGAYAFSYDSRGNLVKVTYPDSTAVELTYIEGSNLVSSEKDRKGRVTAFSYYISDNDSALKSVIDYEGLVTNYTYTENSVEQKGFIKNLKETFLRSGSGTQIQIVDTGVNLLLQYDDKLRLLQSTDHFNLVTSYAYEGNNPYPSHIDYADGTKQDYKYDANNKVIEETFTGGGKSLVTTYTRNAYGEAIQVKTANLIHKYTYDSKGNLLQLVDPANKVAELNAYTSTSLLASTTNIEGDKWSFAYDANGNTKQANYPSGEAFNATFDLLGDMLSSTWFYSHSTALSNYTYDSLGRVTFAYEEVSGPEAKLRLLSSSNYLSDSSEHSLKYDLNGVLFKQINIKLDHKNRPVLIEESMFQSASSATPVASSPPAPVSSPAPITATASPAPVSSPAPITATASPAPVAVTSPVPVPVLPILVYEDDI